MKKIEVFDPPMCCTTGICGTNDNQTLVTFASDLEWLKQQGVDVVRHGLALEPTEFAKNESVKNLINKKGNASLPIITIGTTIISDSCYPSRKQLADICKIEYNEDEAPPIHREENCCCGVDCDCRTINAPNFDFSASKCNCSNAAAEDNCFCEQDFNSDIPQKKSNLKRTIFFVLSAASVFVILAMVYVLVK